MELVGGAEMQSRLVHTHVWQIKIERDITAAEILSEELRVPAPYQAPQPRVQVPEREVPITFGCENQR